MVGVGEVEEGAWWWGKMGRGCTRREKAREGRLGGRRLGRADPWADGLGKRVTLTSLCSILALVVHPGAPRTCCGHR